MTVTIKLCSFAVQFRIIWTLLQRCPKLVAVVKSCCSWILFTAVGFSHVSLQTFISDSAGNLWTINEQRALSTCQIRNHVGSVWYFVLRNGECVAKVGDNKVTAVLLFVILQFECLWVWALFRLLRTSLLPCCQVGQQHPGTLQQRPRACRLS